MTEDQFDARLRILTERIAELPQPQRDRLAKMVEETEARQSQISMSAAEARDAFDDWRLRFKYMLFDAEARARESRQS